jgi:adenylyl-sulfate kinase
MKWNAGKTIWFTGLSGSGKSTLSFMLKTILQSRGVPVVLLDGDLLRSGLNRDLGFSAEDRAENIRRAGELAKILSDEGHTVISAFITPLESLRRAVRGLFETERFAEIFLDCSLEICETRDPKGLYCKARKGEIARFTGISAPFERPMKSELFVPSGEQTVEESLGLILEFLEGRFSDLSLNCAGGRSPVSRSFNKRVFVLGLDCAPPDLVFGEAGKNLTNLRGLMNHGLCGPLRSTDPPITVPAWTSMTTGRDPGELGIYGFRNRPDHGYGEMRVVNSQDVTAPRVWDYLEQAGKTSVLVGIPQTYPPRPHKGITVSGFLAPGLESNFTYPPELADELTSLSGGEYITDVKGFRTDEKDRLLKDLYEMVERRFQLAREFLVHKSWDFFMMVEIAPDRLHHAFWRYCRPDHPRFEPGNPYENVIADFYKFLDDRIGALLGLLSDDTTVIVASDHGARNMQGGVCINEWLMREGYLRLRNRPSEEAELTPDMIDWSETKAWSEGGYYARVFLNVKDREPQGTIDPAEYESVRDGLAARLQAMPDENGQPMANRVLKPQELYRECRNVPPDLLLYFDDLDRRSIGTVGHGDLFRADSGRGPDDANHDPFGIFIATRMVDLRAGIKNGTKVSNASIMDVTPTVLHEFGVALPPDIGGKIMNLGGDPFSSPAEEPASSAGGPESSLNDDSTSQGFTAEEEEIVKQRLQDLGYI